MKKNLLKRLFVSCQSLILISFYCMEVQAHDIEMDGIYYQYNDDGTSVSVTHEGIDLYSAKYTGEVNIPASVNIDGKTYAVSSIDSDAFSGCDGLTSVTIPNSVTSIGSGAFQGCSGLTSMNIPNSVTRIGSNVFEGCRGLSSVNIPNSVTAIGYRSFYGCSGLSTIIIPNSIISINAEAFQDCEGMTSVIIGNSVTSIGDSAFMGCSSLTSIEIPPSVTSIGNSTFMGCSSMTSVEIPPSISSIGASAFAGCRRLTSVYISDVIAWCNITFGNYFEPTLNESNPLYYAHRLYIDDEEIKNLVIPQSVTCINDFAFTYCNSLSSVTIPNSLTKIGSYAFYGNGGLTSVVIPNSVNILDEGSFRDCWQLETVSLGECITSVRSNTFKGCIHIKEIISHIKEPLNMVKNAFADNVYETAKLVVPDGTINKYLACDGWKDFVNIMEESQQESFMLTVNCNEGGEVVFEGQTVRNGSGRLSVNRNQSITLTITPDEGYETKMVTVNGEDVTEDLYNGTYTLAQIKENKNVQVEFAEEATYLSIRQAEGGCVKQRVERGKTYEYSFETESGWRIHSVTFNDENVTNQLDGNSAFTTPAIEENSTLIVVYEKTGSQATALNTPSDSQVSIAGTSFGLRVSNAEMDDIIQVYSADGKFIKAVKANSSQMDIPLDSDHIYIIMVREKVLKVKL